MKFHASQQLRSELVRVAGAQTHTTTVPSASPVRWRPRRLSPVATALIILALAGVAGAAVGIPALTSGTTTNKQFDYLVRADTPRPGKVCLRVSYRDAAGAATAATGACGHTPTAALPIAVTMNGADKLFGIADSSITSITVDGAKATLSKREGVPGLFFVAPLQRSLNRNTAPPVIIAKNASGKIVQQFPPPAPCGTRAPCRPAHRRHDGTSASATRVSMNQSSGQRVTDDVRSGVERFRGGYAGVGSGR